MVAKLEDINEAMKDVVDPELGINVVDLGLIYDMMVDENNIAVLNMTLTSAACPLQDVIEDQTRQALAPFTDDTKFKNFLFGLNLPIIGSVFTSSNELFSNSLILIYSFNYTNILNLF